jgi:antitoxin VapB
MVVRTRLFRTNRSQAVRIPKALAFPDGVDEVEIKVGNTRIITPVGKNWEEYSSMGLS